jgi:hypothetical protein
MKKGLLTLAIVAIALLCNSVYAYAPIIGDIPDVLIGDREDNPTSPAADLNFFRFTNAFNFDKYVTSDPSDPDAGTTYPQCVRWSFLTLEPSDVIKINAIATLADASESIQPDLVGKELTAWPNTDPIPVEGRATSWASFRDLVDSPEGSGPPWADPTTPLDTIVTIYASNGSKTDSVQINVKANIGSGPDMPDALTGVGPILVKSWLTPYTEGWIKSLVGIPDGTYLGRNTDGSPFYVGVHGNTGGDPTGAGSLTQNVWCSWESPLADVPYVANNVYRIQYKISSTQTDVTKVPNCRLLSEFAWVGGMAFAGGNRVGKGLFAPDADGNTYNVYVGPPDLTAAGVTNIRVKFEVIDFDANESGVNRLEEAEVRRFPTPDKAAGTLENTYQTTWTGWIPLTLGSPFGNATVGSTGGNLYIQTAATPIAPVAGQIDYGMWTLGASASGESFEAAKLYRCVYTLQKSASGDQIGKVRLLNASNKGDWSSKIALLVDQTSVHMPSTTGTEYSNWYETMPQLYGTPADNKMSYMFDISDGKSTQFGRCYLTKVELISYDIP